MRMILLLLFFSLFGFSAFATIRTVSNLDAAAQFSTIQAACDASQSGDSIYVSPSVYNYEGFSIIDKKLAVFGPGWSPYVGTPAVVSNCTLTGTAASGSELNGIYFSAGITVNNSDINGLIISRNRIHGILFWGSVANYIIEGNWFDGYSGGFSNTTGAIFSNLMIRNNIFFECGFYGFRGDGTIIDHNLFYGRAYLVFGYSSHLIFSNNILQLECSDGIEAHSLFFSVFNNNITFGVSDISPWNENNNTDAGGNITGQNPQMFDEASVDGDINNPLLNFTITSGPANNTASDGKDMGLLFDKGGVTNWTKCRAVHLPYISEFNITGQDISINGYIKFNGKAKSN